MADNGVAARRAAAGLLGQVLDEQIMLSEALGAPFMQKLVYEDRARAQRLASETLRSLERVDRILKPFMRKPPPLAVHNVLRIAAYELCTGGAAHGVVNDAVTSVGANQRTVKLKGLTNAVLRKVVDKGPEEWAKLRVPHLPKWLRAPLSKAYGAENIAAIERAHFEGAPLDLTPKGDPEALATAVNGTLLPTGSVRIEGAVQVSALAGYHEGDWWVQDAAAALPVQILDPKAGEAIIDLCCAPGGKTMQLTASGAVVTAVDSSERRMQRVSENLTRAKLSAELVVGDALETNGQYDAVLLDAPCSATGTIRRHPDLPLVKDGAEFGELIELQAQMLAHAVTLLKPGGRLVFCTCSLLPDEGECHVEDLLEMHPELEVDRDALKRTGVSEDWITQEGGLRLRPDYWADKGGMDGFYIALLRKTV
ncbi:transcription antitermination factor NusB [Planktotalea sp.]|uniref:RsmB/NOP family class I SAM-dependent RNA methyltransferase n=1 Tax=Planktotalea sp. TaxID=2029877 RepID=UPI0025FE306C|nr:transcription antitermination factor NusB [Planktotalea sp.]